MPDRDPALEAAWNVWWNTRRPRHSSLYVDFGAEEAGFRAGYHAALRSLGAGTPEAQAALRALVAQVPNIRMDAVRRFAALATPTEEGR